MPAMLPPKIRVESVRDDVTYNLPVRPLGKLRWLGLFLVGFGVLFISVPARMEIAFAKQILAGKADLGAWFFFLFVIPFIIAGLMPLGAGVLIVFGRCR